MNRVMNQCLTLMLLLALACLDLAHSAPAAPQKKEDQPRRKLFVPFDDLDVLLLDRSNKRVMLTQQEYEALLEKAKKKTVLQAPLDSSFVSANYQATVQEGIATISGELKFVLLNEGLVRIPMPISGVAIRSATLDDQPASLINQGSNLMLLVDNQAANKNKPRVLKLEMMLPIVTSAAQQTLRLQLPSSTATQFEIAVPGNVEVKSGASVVSRAYSAEQDQTRFELLLPRQTMNLVMSLNNKQLKDERVIVTRSVSIHELTPNDQSLHTTCSVDVINGAVEQLELLVPKGYEIQSVDTRLLSQWSVKKNAQNQATLTVGLREATREDFVVNIKAVSRSAPDNQWVASPLSPLNVAGQVSVIGVLADSQLVASNLKTQSIIPIDHEFLLEAIPPTLGATEPFSGTQSLNIVGAFYSPQPSYDLAIELTEPSPKLIVRSNSLVTIKNESLRIESGIEAISQFDQRIRLPIRLPQGWRILSIQDQSKRDIPFVARPMEPHVAVIQLAQRLDQEPTQLFVTAETTPQGWLDRWQNLQLDGVSIKIDGETEHTGTIAVGTAEDLTITPIAREGLELLEETGKLQYKTGKLNTLIAYKFENTDFDLKYRVAKIDPILLSQAYNFFRLTPDSLVSHCEIIYNVKRAGEDRFQFDLPLTSPTSIGIQTADGVAIKDTQSSEVDGRRRWTVQLASPAKGNVHLLVDFDELREEASEDVELQPVVIPEVTLQNSFVVIEGSSELDTEIQTPGRVVDLGELNLARYKTTRQLVGAYAWSDPQTSIRVRAKRRDFFPLPGAIVQQAELVSVVATDGKLQTSARFSLVTKQLPFLEVELPQDSTLWSIRIDEKPAKPQRQDGRLLVSLPGSNPLAIKTLEVVYETPIEPLGLTGSLDAAAPILRVNRSASDIADWEIVPQIDSKWRLVLPNGYSVTNTNGGDLPRRTVIDSLTGWLQTLGGDRHSFPAIVTVDATKSEPSSSADSKMILPATESEMLRSQGHSFDEDMGEFDRVGSLKESESGEIAAPQESPQVEQDKTATLKSKGELSIQPWVARGLRSLNIQLNDREYASEIYQLDGSKIEAQLVYTSRVTWLSAGLCILLLGLTVAMTRWATKAKMAWLIGLLLLAQGLSTMTQSLPIVDVAIDLIVLAVVLSATYFVLTGTFFRMTDRLWNWIRKRWLPASVTSAALVLLCLIPGVASAQQDPFGATDRPPVLSPDEIRGLLGSLGRPKKLATVPDDVLIVPFDANDPQGQKNADRVLISYDEYQRLKSETGKKPEPAPTVVPYVLASTSYQCRLDAENDNLIEGVILVDVMQDAPVTVPLFLSGGAFASATVDGEPARLQFLQAPANPKRGKGAGVRAAAILHLEGRGRKEFKFSFRIKPVQQGGWRGLRCQLPVGVSRGVQLKTNDEPIEVRVESDSDRRTIQSATAQDINTVLSKSGQLNVQWKPKFDGQSIDQALTVNSDAVFDIREDGLRLNWHLAFSFRGEERNVFTIDVPQEYLVERVIGDNIRAWKTDNDKELPQLEVTLLASVKQNAAFTVELSKRDYAISTDTQQLLVPQLVVPSAALHKGNVTVRKSSVIDLKSGNMQSAGRVDQTSFKRSVDIQRIDRSQSPLGITEFQHYQFRATPFQIALEANVAKAKTSSDIKTMLRIGQSQFDVESLLNLNVSNRILYQLQIQLPTDFEVSKLIAKQNETWTEQIKDNVKQLTIQFPNGISGNVPIVIYGRLQSFGSVPESFDETLAWPLPNVRVQDAERQSIEYAVQTDPAINVVAQDLDGLEVTPIQSLSSWLVPGQRPLTKIAIRSLNQAMNAKRSGQLKLNRIRPMVNVESVTNVRTTLLAVEETLLLDFAISKAGIREIVFEVPAEYRDARINARLLSEKVISDVAGQDRVAITLKLQDDVIGNYRVVAELDRPIPAASQRIDLPTVQTGILKNRFVTLQNAGRDEIEIEKTDGVQVLNRQLSDFAKLTKKLQGAELTMAYLADKNVNQPSMTFRLNTREIVSTVAAGIGFSKTVMMVDQRGTYRAEQVFQVNNRSEPYLDIAIPVDSKVLSVIVDGDPVKPVRWKDNTDQNKLRIPLVKNAEGDLDYPVTIKYAGFIPTLSTFKETSFPVIETLNINVQLSQLHLRLPEDYRWLRFGGTMTQVNEAGELEEDYLAYQSRQIEKLAQQIQTSSNESNAFFSKQRAFENLDVISQELQSNGKFRGNQKLAKLLEGNNKQIEAYRGKLQEQLQGQSAVAVDNRYRFNELVERQQAEVARNSINRAQNYFVETPNTNNEQAQVGGRQDQMPQFQAGQNYTVQVPQKKQLQSQRFNKQWFDDNGVVGQTGKDKSSEGKSDNTRVRELVTLGKNRDQQQNFNRSLNFSNAAVPADPSQPVAQSGSNTTGGARFQQFQMGAGGGGFGGGGVVLGNTPEQYQGGFGRQNENPSPNQSGSGDFGSRFSQQSAQPQRSIRGRLEVEGLYINGRLPAGSGLSNSEPTNATEQAEPTGHPSLASLDFELPARGVDFYFRAPRGTVSVTAVPVQEQLVQTSLSTLLIVVTSILAWIVSLAVLQVKRFGGRAILSLLIGLAGFVSMVSGIYPAFGLVVVIAAIGIAIGPESADSGTE